VTLDQPMSTARFEELHAFFEKERASGETRERKLSGCLGIVLLEVLAEQRRARSERQIDRQNRRT